MRVTQVAAALLLALGATEAFAPFGVVRHHKQTIPFMSEEAITEEEEEPTPAPEVPTFEPSGLTISQVRATISKLSADSFTSDLSTIEPFLLNEAGSTFYAKSMKRIAQKAKELSTAIPEGYAFEARATAKRRSKQDEFIKAKEEERLAAEAEAADAEPAEETEAAEETANEPELVEA